VAESVKDGIRSEILAQALVDDRAPTDDEDLFVSGFLDSLVFMNLLIFIRNEFGVSFDRTEVRYENFNSIRAIVARVEKRLGA
jgi:acyl carrier protein